MTDIVSTPLLGYAAATGITLAGVATGINPVLMGFGACGGWWALSYIETPTPVGVRINNIALSSVIASAGAAVAGTELVEHGWIREGNELAWSCLIAIALGLLTMPVLGSLVMSLGRGVGRWLQRWVDRLGEPK